MASTSLFISLDKRKPPWKKRYIVWVIVWGIFILDVLPVSGMIVGRSRDNSR